jgi:hypothetical protein
MAADEGSTLQWPRIGGHRRQRRHRYSSYCHALLLQAAGVQDAAEGCSWAAHLDAHNRGRRRRAVGWWSVEAEGLDEARAEGRFQGEVAGGVPHVQGGGLSDPWARKRGQGPHVIRKRGRRVLSSYALRIPYVVRHRSHM